MNFWTLPPTESSTATSSSQFSHGCWGTPRMRAVVSSTGSATRPGTSPLTENSYGGTPPEATRGASYERPTFASTVVSGGFVIDVPLEGVVDPVLEKGRLDTEVKKVKKELSSVEGKLSNEKFIQKAPEDVIAKEKDKKEKLVFKKSELEDRIEIVKRYLEK